MLEQELKVSIVIPVHNGEKTLGRCLSSILDQTYSNFEVIVVDNNSTDKTKEIIKGFQNKNSRVSYIFESQKGRGPARNTGEKTVTGEIILMTDVDCFFSPGWIEKMVAPIIVGEAEAVQGFQQPIEINFWSGYHQLESLEKIKPFNGRILSSNIIGKIDTKNFAIKAGILKKVGLTSRKYVSGNDTELSIRLNQNRVKVKFSQEVTVKHQHPSSFTAVIIKQLYRGMWCFIITNDYRAYLKDSKFLELTGQTKKSFFKMPALLKVLKQKGWKWAWYDFITGLAWRVGVLKGKLKIAFRL